MKFMKTYVKLIKTYIKHITTYTKPIQTYIKHIKTYTQPIKTLIQHLFLPGPLPPICLSRVFPFFILSLSCPAVHHPVVSPVPCPILSVLSDVVRRCPVPFMIKS